MRNSPQPDPNPNVNPPFTQGMKAERVDRGRHQVIGDGLAWTARWSLRWLLIAAGAVLVGVVVREVWTIVLPVVLALIATSVLLPLSLLLERRLRFPAAVAAATVLVGAIGVVLGAGVAISPMVAGQLDDIASDASAGLKQLQDWVEATDVISENQIEGALEGLQDRLADSATSIAGGALGAASAVGSGVVTLVITLILTFLFLKDGRRFLPWVMDLSGEKAGSHLVEVLRRCWDTLGGFIRTQALVSFIDAVLIGVALIVVGVPLAVPLAILTFFGGFVPIVGAFVVGALAVLVALVSVGWTGALIVMGVIVAVQQIEGNVLSPWLQARSMHLHPAVVLLSVTLGSTLFGIVGAFLAVPVVAVAAVILAYLNDVVSQMHESIASQEADERPSSDLVPASVSGSAVRP